ncbi:methionine ABC transporter permease [Deinococcus radiodurans]|jgi:ABC-type metal ion transport system, permease component|uniref:ABC transporter, permease protein n=1 Tax=Deinococcus radiodurans (strain ATCC 13939 / DSM 20539 / JCM 16871 / CCUG 27074 / LMG 4051 / NBRC 15346 / NCIMB 9279 / VKM B-1422 / R1) TaxID=243230 RepID=Q9RUM7_DEIRA|nr:methionine ABC transporter permease [Deinococcus radiodurans]AAF10929.1 ABC transporter, permease protein [Deinococcus radiodurans R1 = ATCC 13939 = DSM 20539]ANC71492.1 methionine ABC transporter permease [Deinococcus radiodurans R1 = ATCC 13939 = DSM 20539]QEM70819.1 ABC transporter permease [Deinococcus radiodurans]QIP29392.1 ABC transporter permease [Deinococcus radiodurans]QIP31913.1 ABC transporter permease [Deinococcus radiodurans]
MSWAELGPLLWQGTLETLWMVLPAALIAEVLGVALGVLLTLTRPGGLKANGVVFRVLDALVNIGRSLPFIILLVLLIPLTRLVTGTSIGSTAAIVPLTIAAIPFVARLVDGALRDVPHGVTEAARAMGASTAQVVGKVLLPEARPALIHSFTVMFVSLIGYSAMAGAIGGGGLGDLAIRYGYQRFETGVMIATVLVLLLLVQGAQWLGDRAAARADHR